MQRLEAFKATCDEPAVRLADPVGEFLRRGMTVAAYNLLETFIDDRLGELASYVNTGHVQFVDLPERLQKRAIRNTLAVANARFGRGSIELMDLRTTAASLGRSLGAVSRSFQ